MMYECKYPHLFSPIRLGDTLFRNRYFAAPVAYEYLSSKNYPIDETVAFFERKAVGGAATVNIGSAMPDSKRGAIGGFDNLNLDDPTALPAIYRLASAISRHGAVAAIELQHCGANSYSCAARGNQIYGAVDGLNPLGQFVPAMPEEVIEETIEAFANAAAYAKFCGFGMVTIHAGHGWLLNQFLDPLVNNRKDRWGGSLENRCRLPIVIIERIKEKCGHGFPVDIRISGSACYEGGYGIDEGIAIARQLDGKVDMIHVSAGSHEVAEVFTVTHPSMFLPDGANVVYAAEIKKHVKTPVATVGALGDPELMEEIIASGKADVVLAARALLADPDMPKKARAGRSDEIRPCIRCFECFAGITTKRQYRCAVNPQIGFEQDCRHEPARCCEENRPRRRRRRRRDGGGAHRLAARAQCNPLRKERSPRRCAQMRGKGALQEAPFGISRLPGEDDLSGAHRCAPPYGGNARARESRRSRRHHCRSRRAPDNAEDPGPGRRSRPQRGRSILSPGEDRQGRCHYRRGACRQIELAIYLSGLGRKVLIVEMMETLSDGGNPVHGLALINEMKKFAIQVSTATRAVEINGKGVVGAYVGSAATLPPCSTVQAAVLQSNVFGRVVRADAREGSRQLFEADTVIYATGQRPLLEEVEALRFCAPEFHQIGDCLAPKNIQQATRMAFAVARDI